MRKGFGVLCMLLGVCMLLGAGWIIAGNRSEEKKAEEGAAQVLEVMMQAVQEENSILHTALQQEEAPAVLPKNAPHMPDAEMQVDELLPADDVLAVDVPEMPQRIQESIFPGDMPVVEIDGHGYIGYLEMPTIGISLPVMDDWSYPQLRIAPCRYHGSAYDDTMVIMAHNYERHFGLLASLQLGDPVQFVDMQGNIFRYVVERHEQLSRSEVKRMVANEWDLTLFSCTYGGGARVTVRLNRVKTYE